MAWLRVSIPVQLADTGRSWTTDFDTDTEVLVEKLSEDLMSSGALSISVVPDPADPVLEPRPGQTPLAYAARVEALYKVNQDIGLIRSAVLANGLTVEEIDFVEEKNWSQTWKDLQRPRRHGKLWLIPPEMRRSELKERPDESDILRIEPGLAFGSGTHETTSLCLDWIVEKEFRGKTLLDFGCGSGILGIAAAKCGAARVLAVDYDAQALVATDSNSAVNSVVVETYLHTHEQIEKLGSGFVDVIVANILATTLIDIEPILMTLSRSDSDFVLSGILVDQVNEVIEGYPRLDFSTPYLRGDWAMLHGRRNLGAI